MHCDGGHGEEGLDAGEHCVLGHVVVVLAGEVGFQNDEIRLLRFSLDAGQPQGRNAD